MMDSTQEFIALGDLSLKFGRVDRITYHQDGKTPESDTDHTVMLGLVACAFAHRHLPYLDLGLIAQYCLAHDLVEVYAGDTPTLVLGPNTLRDKKIRELSSRNRIDGEFTALPWVSNIIHEYEAQIIREARYVRAMDKLVPKITHILNGCVTIREQRMSIDRLKTRYAEQLLDIAEYAGEFFPLFSLRAELVDLVIEIMEDRRG